MAIRCDGCGARAGVAPCARCGELLCDRCAGAGLAGICEACLHESDDADELWPVVEDVRVNRAIL